MIKDYLARHGQVLFSTIGDFWRTPISTLLSVLVIAVTLAIPALGFQWLQFAVNSSQHWQQRPELYVYLVPNLALSDAQAIQAELDWLPGVRSTELISANKALEEFRQESGLGEVLNHLTSNPLPATLVISPTDDVKNPDRLQMLAADIQRLDGIDRVNLNSTWLTRYHAILAFVKMFLTVTALLLALAVLLITSNTIRLLIQDRRSEIRIMQLVGATRGFVRRPFLYFGALLGAAGGLLAAVVCWVGHWLLQAPLGRLLATYQAEFVITAPSMTMALILVAVGFVLGWVAARLSVARFLTFG